MKQKVGLTESMLKKTRHSRGVPLAPGHIRALELEQVWLLKKAAALQTVGCVLGKQKKKDEDKKNWGTIIQSYGMKHLHSDSFFVYFRLCSCCRESGGHATNSCRCN